jgi:hypothetical protein
VNWQLPAQTSTAPNLADSLTHLAAAYGLLDQEIQAQSLRAEAALITETGV